MLRLLMLAAVLLCGAAIAAPPKTDGGVKGSKYRVGQVWKFKSRPGEDAATLTIVKIDESKTGPIVHVSLSGLRVKNPQRPSGFSETIGHMPFSEAAIAKSVTTPMADASELPKFEDGYAAWRKAWDAGKAGFFTVPVAEAISAIEAGLNK